MTTTMKKRGPGRPRKTPKKAPEAAILDEYYKDERKAQIEYAKSQLGEAANGMHFFHGNGRLVSQDPDYYKRQSYIPVVVNDKQLGHKGDLLYMRSEELNMIDREAPAIAARQQCQDRMDESEE